MKELQDVLTPAINSLSANDKQTLKHVVLGYREYFFVVRIEVNSDVVSHQLYGDDVDFVNVSKTQAVIDSSIGLQNGEGDAYAIGNYTINAIMYSDLTGENVDITAINLDGDLSIAYSLQSNDLAYLRVSLKIFDNIFGEV